MVAISTPIDLAACATRLTKSDNRLYERRFVERMKQRLIATGRYSEEELAPWHSVYAIDDNVTAPSFGFGTAENYYATQSARNFLDSIRVPSLCIQARDDTFVPFEIFDHPAFRTNPVSTFLPPITVVISDFSRAAASVSGGMTRRSISSNAWCASLYRHWRKSDDDSDRALSDHR